MPSKRFGGGTPAAGGGGLDGGGGQAVPGHEQLELVRRRALVGGVAGVDDPRHDPQALRRGGRGQDAAGRCEQVWAISGRLVPAGNFAFRLRSRG